jgi:hypothetical protein
MAVNESPQVGLSNFISKVKTGGLARANRFGVLINAPFDPSFSDNYADFTSRDLFMYCDNAQIPGLNFATTQARTYGEFREMPYEKLFDVVTLSFYVDNDMKVRRFWESWINKIQDPYSRHVNYYDNYVGTVIVYVYDVNNNNRYAVTLEQAYPKTIAAIQLDSQSRDMMKISVTIQYKYFRTSFFGEPTESQRVASGAFTTAAGAISSQITAARAIPDDYFSSFDSFQNTFSGLTESVSNNPLNQLTNQISNAVPGSLSELVNFELPWDLSP